jgi:hypothetical protein
VTRGIQRQAGSGWLGALLEMLQSGGHQQNLGNPPPMAASPAPSTPATMSSARSSAGKEVSRQVAAASASSPASRPGSPEKAAADRRLPRHGLPGKERHGCLSGASG